MTKRKYGAPFVFGVDVNPSGGTVIGEGTGQGSIAPEGMTYERWWVEIAWGGKNPDADYDQDGDIDEEDYEYWLEEHLWNGGN